MMLVGTVYATCSSPISRSNFSANSILTSSDLNTQFNTVYNHSNDLSGTCITDATLTNDKFATGAIANSTVTSKSAAYTITTSDQINLGNASGGAFTYTLPTASGNSGLRLVIKKTDSSENAITIDGNGSETIDGDTTLLLNAENDFVEIISDGSNWQVIDNGLKDRIETKILGSDQTSAADIISFTGLTVGKIYELSGQVNYAPFDGQDPGVKYFSASSGSGTQYGSTNQSLSGVSSNKKTSAVSLTFVATSTALYIYKYTSLKVIYGDGTKDETFFTIKENNGGGGIAETTDF